MKGLTIITQEKLKHYFSYDDLSGIFTWKNPTSRRCKPGMQAGNKHYTGYVHMMVENKFYQAHRLAWLYIYGILPTQMIDHIYGNKSNNSISNLRLATDSENLQNQRASHKHSKTGILGVTYRRNRWEARIMLNGKSYSLGSYDNPEDASKAYQLKKKELHPFSTI